MDDRDIVPSVRRFFLLLLIAFPAIAEQKWDPIADPKAVIVEGSARFTVLTPRLVRMEWAADGHFEDHASLVFVNRRLPVPDFKITRENGWLVLRTSAITLRYRGGEFSSESRSVQFDATTWKPGMEYKGNLGGTIRTLDGARRSDRGADER